MGSISSDHLPRPMTVITSLSGGPAFTLPLSRVRKQQLISQFSAAQTDYGEVQLQNSDEYAYLVSLSVGGQHFQAIFDTGSSDLWIVSSACKSLDCQRIKKYDPTPSLALANVPFNLTYLSGAVSGSIGYETVSFGPYVVFSQILALANSTTNMGLSASGVSGVLGLAFPKEAAIPVTSGRTLLDNIFASLDSSERLLSYKLGADDSSSSFSVGTIDTRYIDRVSEISYSPVFVSDGADYDYWKLPLLSLSVNSASMPFAFSKSKVHGAPAPIAVLDTGTTLILGPSHDVDNFWTVAGNSRKSDDGRWQVRCDHVVAVGFLLGNDTARQEVILDPSDVSWMPAGKTPTDGWCLGGIQINDGVFSGDWLFGDTFLRNAYIVHHAATESSPPLIGLLGTTNASQTVQQFQVVRGNESSSSLSHPGMLFHNARPPTPAAIFSSTVIISFLGGASLGVLLRTLRDKRRSRKTMMKVVHRQ